MTAVLETPAAEEALGGFSLVVTSADNPQVAALRRAYFARMKVQAWEGSPSVKWFALAKDDTIYCAIGAVMRYDGGVEVSDFYATPDHEGVRAGWLALEFLKHLVDAKKIPYFFGLILTANKTGQRHFERAFGCGPSSYCYMYPGTD